ncbi:hypothetical protein EDD76_108153 [Kineothrix alysoides]|uniref:Uncharacterized protein n=1 Tax=Kineothrix alysoides TaxID=1469948 RepID=A0A4R1QUL4_9FIRM|nr:hypothetical protein [Kineothrix alysoides]TCL57618.1 hypothetical protein EDD76_108153 [Kineothrix alysoides]
MKVCSFFGQKEVYNKKLKLKIKKEIEAVLPCDNSFIFYFYLKDNFSYICFRAVKQLQQMHKDKDISIVCVNYRSEDYKDHYFETPMGEMSNLQNYDNSFILHVPGKNDHWYHNSLRVQKWIITESDFVFYYLYDKFSITHMSLLSLLKKQQEQGKIILTDITYKSTQLKVKKIIASLPTDIQYVYTQLNDGTPTSKLSKELGLSVVKLYQKYRTGVRSLSVLKQNVEIEKP